jgi:hypothetical protein
MNSGKPYSLDIGYGEVKVLFPKLGGKRMVENKIIQSKTLFPLIRLF